MSSDKHGNVILEPVFTREDVNRYAVERWSMAQVDATPDGWTIKTWDGKNPIHTLDKAGKPTCACCQNTFRVVLVDQFTFNPYKHKEENVTVADFQPGGKYYEAYAPYAIFPREPKVLHVTDDFKPRIGTTVLKENADGFVSLWRANWDSSG